MGEVGIPNAGSQSWHARSYEIHKELFFINFVGLYLFYPLDRRRGNNLLEDIQWMRNLVYESK